MEIELLKRIAQGEGGVVVLLIIGGILLWKRVTELNNDVKQLRDKNEKNLREINDKYCEAIAQFSSAVNELKNEFTKRYELVEQFSSTLKSIQKIIEANK